MKTSRGRARIGSIAALTAIIIVATQTVSHAQLAATPWPMISHDLRHTGLSTVDTSANPGKLKWVYDMVDQYGTSPICLDGSLVIGADGTIYAGCDQFLYAVNADGTLKWKFATGTAIESTPAIGADGTIYVGSFDDHLYAVTDGGQGTVTEKWAFATGDDVSASP